MLIPSKKNAHAEFLVLTYLKLILQFPLLLKNALLDNAFYSQIITANELLSLFTSKAFWFIGSKQHNAVIIHIFNIKNEL